MPTPLNVTQQYDAPATEVFALFNDPDFIAGRLEDSGAPDAAGDDGGQHRGRRQDRHPAVDSGVSAAVDGRVDDLRGPGHRAHRGLAGRRRGLCGATSR